MINRFRLLLLLVLIVLSACGTDQTAQQDATRQFLTERNGGTPVTIGAADNGPVVGTIEQVNGETLLVKSPLRQASVTVKLGTDTAVRKQAEVDRSAIAIGATITVVGTRTANGITAEVVQIGEGGLLSSGMVQLGGSATTRVGPPRAAEAPPDGASASDAAQAPASQGPAVGTVAQIDQSTLTITSADGSQTVVQLTDTTQIFQQVDVPRSELQPGLFVSATGTQADGSMAATVIELLPPPTQS